MAANALPPDYGHNGFNRILSVWAARCFHTGAILLPVRGKARKWGGRLGSRYG